MCQRGGNRPRTLCFFLFLNSCTREVSWCEKRPHVSHPHTHTRVRYSWQQFSTDTNDIVPRTGLNCKRCSQASTGLPDLAGLQDPIRHQNPPTKTTQTNRTETQRATPTHIFLFFCFVRVMVRETATRHLSQSCAKRGARQATQHDTIHGKGLAAIRMICLR